MNIFYLDSDPYLCADYHCDVHVNKMIVEGVQLLSNALHLSGCPWYPTKPTHLKHPCTLWVSQSIYNYEWLLNLVSGLCIVYINISHKQHSYAGHLYHLNRYRAYINDGHWTEPPICMPDWCKIEGDVVGSYRNYYGHKEAMFKRNKMTWTNRPVPEWYERRNLPTL